MDWDEDEIKIATKRGRGRLAGEAQGARKRTRRGTVDKPDAAYAQPVQVDLENGERITVAREIYDPYLLGDTLIASCTLLNERVRVKMMDGVGQWRPCDGMGRYRKVVLPNDTRPWKDKDLNGE